MLITIQIPTYNQKQYIKQALDSALAQDYDNLQIIVSDDCSSDYDIFDFLKDYRNNPKVLIHRNRENLGRVGNYRNTLYNLVKGEYFVNLDGDDYFINPGFISHAAKSIKSTSHEIAVFQANSKLEKIKENKLSNIQIDENTYLVKGFDCINNLENGLGYMHGSTIVNTKLARKANFYNIDVLDSDYFSFLKILKNGEIIFWNKKVYEIRIHSERATYTSTFEKIKEKTKAFEDLKVYYSNVDSSKTEKMLKITEKNLFNQLINFWIIENNKIKKMPYLFKKIYKSENSLMLIKYTFSKMLDLLKIKSRNVFGKRK